MLSRKTSWSGLGEGGRRGRRLESGAIGGIGMAFGQSWCVYDYGDEKFIGAGGPVDWRYSRPMPKSIKSAARHRFSVQRFQILSSL